MLKYLPTFLMLSLASATFSQNLLKNIATSDESSIIYSNLVSTPKSSIVKGDTLFYVSGENGVSTGNYTLWMTNNSSTICRRVPSVNDPQSTYSILNEYKKKIYCSVDNYRLVSTDGNSINYVRDFGYSDQIVSSYVIRDTLFFMVNINFGSRGLELWKTDGTTSNTKKVLTVTTQPFYYNHAPEGSSVVSDNKFYFSLSANGNGFEPWVSDGTASGTFMLKNISSGANSSYPSSFTKVGSQVFFVTESNLRLWKTDGTTSGTVLVSNIEGINNYRAYSLIEFSNYLYLMANNSKLYKTDGNTFEVVKDGLSNIQKFVKTDNLLFFMNKSGNDYDLWKSDGTSIGTQKIKTLINQPDSSPDLGFIITSGQSKCYIYNYYQTYNILPNNSEHWVSDGSVLGTKKIKELNPSFTTGSLFTPIKVVRDTYYFTAFENSSGFELWKSDGSVTETKLVKNANTNVGSSNPKLFSANNNIVYFTADDIKNGRELWKTEGTQNTTQLYGDFNAGSIVDVNISSAITCMASLNNSLIAQLNNFMVRIDGMNPPIIVTHTPEITNPENPEFTKFNGKLYYAGWSAAQEYEYDLWSTDGITTNLVKDLTVNSSVGKPTGFLVAGVFLYFKANSNKQLWKSDGTGVGTTIVKEFTTGTIQSSLVDVNGQVFFCVNDNTTGTELWVSDGTATGTRIVNDIISGTGSSNPTNLVSFKGFLYFTAYDGSNFYIYKTDGTEINTIPIFAGNAENLKVFKDKLYFYASNFYGTNEIQAIWYSNGNVNGAYKLISLYNDIYDKSDFFNVEDKYLIFDVLPNRNTDELWIIDGTSLVTQKVKTIRNTPIRNSFHITEFFFHNKKVYFAADDGINGKELWMWDFSCQDNYTVTDILATDTTLIYDKYIIGINTIQPNVKVNFNANNYIELKNGFDTRNGVVFNTNLVGCRNIPSNSLATNNFNNNPVFQTSIVNTELKHQPNIQQFLERPSNIEIRDIYLEYKKKGNVDKLSWIVITSANDYILKLLVNGKEYFGYLPKE